ncbi:hypothetical protein NDU88_004589 [Pleurodeles waltl]|uniref:Uncharacterized protein n=1 Tax=Pleurodeles waltl TaxID=8319 RepID=A0AAV7SJ79_PLEWA|nr:hypothetical protein NDU88_004589 [Pleurodeles waltl]
MLPTAVSASRPPRAQTRRRPAGLCNDPGLTYHCAQDEDQPRARRCPGQPRSPLSAGRELPRSFRARGLRPAASSSPPGQQGTHGTARDAPPVRILVAFTGG